MQKEKKKIRLDVRLINDPSPELIEHSELVWLTNLNHTLLNSKITQCMNINVH